MKISKELLKGSTKMLILEMVKDENMYGYQMIKKLKEKSNNVFFPEATGPMINKFWLIFSSN